MNPRIQALIAKSQKVVGHTDGGYTELKALDPERFAQLIVEECAGIVASSSLPDTYSEPCLIEIANEIKEHFGVEE